MKSKEWTQNLKSYNTLIHNIGGFYKERGNKGLTFDINMEPHFLSAVSHFCGNVFIIIHLWVYKLSENISEG